MVVALCSSSALRVLPRISTYTYNPLPSLKPNLRQCHLPERRMIIQLMMRRKSTLKPLCAGKSNRSKHPSSRLLPRSPPEAVDDYYLSLNEKDLDRFHEIIAEECIFEDLAFSKPFEGQVLSLCLLVMIETLGLIECTARMGLDDVPLGPGCRAHTVKLTDFGGVGDGKMSNTKAFKAAIHKLSGYSGNGGGLLYVPAGKWLTGPFNVTSHFTLFLDQHAEILATTDFAEWSIIAPLPSYGQGRDGAGPRYSNFIGGSNLTDVIITGNNGTINGQGQVWWDKFHKHELQYTRGNFLEIMYSDKVLISNLTFVDSPNWNLHPVYCSNVVIANITILAPVNSPNTDGIDPDSCSGVRIEDCYIVSGDDCIAIKSGWDEYGIKVGIPSEHIIIRRLTCISPTSAVIAIGSEMSGGVRDVRAEDITAINSESGVRLKTAVGRGNYIKDIYVRRMNLYTMKWVFWMSGNYRSHPDNKYDPKAVPKVTDINYSHVYATNVTMAAKLEGTTGAPFTGICMSNVTAEVIKSKKPVWNCTDVSGVTSNVSPTPCAELPKKEVVCPFPEDRLPVEDVVFGNCAA